MKHTLNNRIAAQRRYLSGIGRYTGIKASGLLCCLLPLLLWGHPGTDPAKQPTRPNIVLIMADDLGFSDLGCYGGEVETPQLDKLAKNGLRYKQFYNAARCCPSRAALMTGLYPHQAGMGWMAAADLGTPAYAGNLNTSSVTIAEVLKTAGYNTYMAGKWHLTNERKISGKVIDNWPIQRGFDRYFGIIPGGANYFTPTVYSNNTSYDAPENYYLTHAISDTSVTYIRDHFRNNQRNPFFLYVAYTAPHWPLHALQPEIDKYVARYKQGWDRLRRERFERQRSMGLINSDQALSPRDSAVMAWDRLSAAEQDEMAMRMAIYAAQIDLMDQGIGRIMDELRRQGAFENTLVFFLSDNGACAEYISSGKSKEVDGTNSDTFESYRIQWANVSSTPFREYKHFVHEGGIASPLIVHWPKGVRAGLKNSFVEGYGHITDLMATCADVAGATYPNTFRGHTIQPLEGKSLLPHFTGGDNQRGKVFWEHEANIAMRDGKWKMVAKTKENATFNRQSVELYDMETDPAELNNLAGRFPERVESMYRDWNTWAHKIGVYPMDTREYGARMRAYRRSVNGDFNDHLGGWNIRIADPSLARIEVDTTGAISGKNAAKISLLAKPGRRGDVVMNWPFPAKKGEQFRVQIAAKGNRQTAFRLTLEPTEGDHGNLLNEEVRVTTSVVKRNFETATVPADGMYRIRLTFDHAEPGSQIWIDDVSLTEKTAAGKTASHNVIPMADPTIFPDRGTYYLYGTGPNASAGFQVYTSKDLQHWQRSANPALRATDVFGDRGFWAPQVFEYRNRFYMAYTANERIAIAEAATPAGPFLQRTEKPLDDTKRIDPFVFDDNGTLYLYHVRVGNGANRIVVAELNEDLTALKPGTEQLCLEATLPWETAGKETWRVAEGPTVWKEGDYYYLLYSTNHFQSPEYAVGYATAKHPRGPWTKYEGNPIIHRTHIGQHGPGHGDLLRTADGYFYVFHTHASTSAVSPRKTALIRLHSEPAGSGKPNIIRTEPASFSYLYNEN